MADLTRADREAIDVMPAGWFHPFFPQSYKVRRVEWRCERLFALGRLDRRAAADRLGWEYQKRAPGVKGAAPKLCNYCGVVIGSGMACATDGDFNHCPNKQIGEVIAGVKAVAPTQQRKATDAEIQEWADRHDLGRSSITELRCIFEDAESLHLTRGVKTAEAPSQCEYCFDLGWEWEEGDDNSWKVPCPRNCAAAVKWLADASGVRVGAGQGVAAQTPTGKDQ